MEAIKDDAGSLIFFAIILVVGVTLIILTGILAFSPTAKIVTAGEVFEVVGDSSKYSCVISEIDNDLSLNCLETN